MPRPPRHFSTECAYHVISRGNNRQTLFKDAKDFEQFLFYLRFLKSEFPFYLYHYCLMSNHVHLLIQFPEIRSLQKVPQRLFLLYAKYFARRYRHVGHVFQDRFKSLPVTDNRYLLDCGRYIERNPVKARLVEHPSEYKWSSFRFYGEGQENDLLTANPLFTDFSNGPNGAQRYEQFVCVDRPYEEAVEIILLGLRRRPKVSL